MMPPGLVNRAARYLEAAATLVNEGVFPEDFSTTQASQLDGRAGSLRACLCRSGGRPAES
jgi:hypothetical protein